MTIGRLLRLDQRWGDRKSVKKKEGHLTGSYRGKRKRAMRRVKGQPIRLSSFFTRGGNWAARSIHRGRRTEHYRSVLPKCRDDWSASAPHWRGTTVDTYSSVGHKNSRPCQNSRSSLPTAAFCESRETRPQQNTPYTKKNCNPKAPNQQRNLFPTPHHTGYI